jgi:hypothetical protein
MVKVTLKFTDSQARIVASYLRKRYGKDGRTTLAMLCKKAVLREAAGEARKELEGMKNE